MNEDLSREDVNKAIDSAIAELLGSAGVLQPPVDAILLARDHLHLDLDKGPRGRKPIALDEASLEQRQLAAALIIAAHCKPDLMTRLGIDPEAMRLPGESLTSRFADCLLVPTPWLVGLARSTAFDLFALKEQFSTASHELIAWRFLDLDEPCIVTLIDDGRVSRRRSNAFPVNRTLFDPETECQRKIQRSGEPARVSADEWDVLGWPAGERIILLSRRT